MILVDTGVMLAALDSADTDHDDCARLLQSRQGPFRLPALVITEVVYFAEGRLGVEAELRFLADVGAGNLIPEPPAPEDWERTIELVWQYRDFPLGTVDASVVAAAERLGVATIATLDRRHFRAVQPRHVDSFELVP